MLNKRGQGQKRAPKEERIEPASRQLVLHAPQLPPQPLELELVWGDCQLPPTSSHLKVHTLGAGQCLSCLWHVNRRHRSTRWPGLERMHLPCPTCRRLACAWQCTCSLRATGSLTLEGRAQLTTSKTHSLLWTCQANRLARLSNCLPGGCTPQPVTATSSSSCSAAPGLPGQGCVEDPG